ILANGRCETPVGAKASMRPRSASARGGSLAAHGKRVYSICGNQRANFLLHFFSTRHLMMGYTLRTYVTSAVWLNNLLTLSCTHNPVNLGLCYTVCLLCMCILSASMASAAPGNRVYSICCDRKEYFVFTPFYQSLNF